VSETPIHPLYNHFSELPASLRVMYTAALIMLGLGYLFAAVYLFHSHSGKDGNPRSLSYEDVVIAYSGTGKGSKLETALRGSMSAMLPYEEREMLLGWVKDGAERARFEPEVRPIIDRRCLACHDGGNPNLPNLIGYDNMLKVTEQDTGTGIFTLVRVSHIHMFGLTFVFFLLGTIFSHAYVRPVWFKCTVVALPFVSLALDISSWYFTKIFHPFAWVVMISGGVMALSFAYMWFVSMWQMWFGRLPEAIAQRRESQMPDVG
jgi:magnesium-transporting ATPase (P-type)